MATTAAVLAILVEANTGAANRNLAKTNVQLKETAAQARATTSGFSRAQSSIKSAGETMASTGKKMQHFGRTMTTHVTLPIVAIAGAAVKMSADFDNSMSLISRQAGASQREVHKLTGEVLELAKHSEFGPKQLADALFHVESVGYRGAKAMKVLHASVELATVGNSDLETTTNAVAAAMQTGIKGTESLGKTVGTLNAIIGRGNLRLDEFTSSLSSGVLVTAQQVNVSLRDVGGAMGVMTARGISAHQAATALNMAMLRMATLTPKGAKALQSIGIGANDLANAMRQGGLPAAIDLLQKKLDKVSQNKSNQVLTDAFGIKSAKAVRTLVGHVDDLHKRVRGIAKDTGDFHDKLRQAEEQPLTKLRTAWSQIQVALVKLGKVLVPVVVPMLQKAALFVSKMADKFSEASPATQRLVVELAGMAAAIGPIAAILGIVVRGFGVLAPLFAGMVSPVGLATAAFLLLGHDALPQLIQLAHTLVMDVSGIARAFAAVLVPIASFTNTLFNTRVGMMAVGALFGALAGYAAAFGARLVILWAAMKVGAIVTLITELGGLKAALNALTVAAAADPFTAILVIIGAVAGAMGLFSTKTEKAVSTQADLRAALDDELSSLRQLRLLTADNRDKQANLTLAQLNYRDAIKAAHNAINKYGKGSEAARRADAERKLALSDLQRAQDAVRHKDADAAAKVHRLTAESHKNVAAARDRVKQIRGEIVVATRAGFSDEKLGKLRRALRIATKNLAEAEQTQGRVARVAARHTRQASDITSIATGKIVTAWKSVKDILGEVLKQYLHIGHLPTIGSPNFPTQLGRAAGRAHGAHGGWVTTAGIRGFAGGGAVGTTDTVPAMLTPGEFVVKAASAKKSRGALEALNRGATGGHGALGNTFASDTAAIARQAAASIKDELSRGYDDTQKATDDFTGKHEKSLKAMQKTTATHVRRMQKDTTDKFKDTQRVSNRSTNTLQRKTQSDFTQMRSQTRARMDSIVGHTKDGFNAILKSGKTRGQQLRDSVRGTMGSIDSTTFQGMVYIGNATNDALKVFGAKAVKFSVSKPVLKERGGPVGGWGERGKDAIPALLGRGEAVLTHHHQKPVDYALRSTYGFGLQGLFNRESTPHSQISSKQVASGSRMAKGGCSKKCSKCYEQGGFVGLARGGYPHLSGDVNEPKIDPLIEALAKKIGQHITIYSGFRTPADNARVHGASGSNHLTGCAADLSVSYPGVSQATMHSVGLSWPLIALGPKEWNHTEPIDLAGCKAGKVGAAAAAIKHIQALKVGGPDGGSKRVIEAALETVRGSANKYIDAHSFPTGVGCAGLPALWIAAGGDPKWAAMMATVAQCESTCNPRAVSSAGCVGLWQICTQPVAGDRMNPLINAKNAVALQKARPSLSDWNPSRHCWGAYAASHGFEKGGFAGPYLGAYAGGGRLPRDGYYKGHKDEVVVPSQVVQKFDQGGIASASTAKPSRVFEVMMENRDYGTIIKRGKPPHWGRSGATAKLHEAGSPSLPNYFAYTSGRTFGVHTDKPGGHPGHGASNLFSQLKNAGIHTQVYAAGPKKHRPWSFYGGVKQRPFAKLAGDLRSGSGLGQFNWVTPGLKIQGHSPYSVGPGMKWLNKAVPAMKHQMGPHGLVIVTWDEGLNTSSMPLVIMGPDVKKGAHVSGASPYSVLQLVEDVFGVGLLGHAGSAKSLRNLFVGGHLPNVLASTGTPGSPGAQPGTHPGQNTGHGGAPWPGGKWPAHVPGGHKPKLPKHPTKKQKDALKAWTQARNKWRRKWLNVLKPLSNQVLRDEDYATRAETIGGKVFGTIMGRRSKKDQIGWLRRELGDLWVYRNNLIRYMALADHFNIDANLPTSLKTLAEVQGLGSPKRVLRHLRRPFDPRFGGDILATQSAIRDALGGAGDSTTAVSEAKDELIASLRRQLRISQLQYPVLRSANYAGSFGGGGVIPGPPGKPYLATVHGGERYNRYQPSDDGKLTIVINGDISNVPAGKDAVEAFYNDRRFDAAVQRSNRRASRRGNNPNPGRGGGGH